MNESFVGEGRWRSHATRWRTATRWRVGCAVLAAVVPLIGASTPARANGAFPAPFRVFLPAVRLAEVTVTSNFGFITTRDGGATWAWTCEHDQGDLGASYQQAASGGRFLGLANSRLVLTDDDACDWTVASGFPATELIDDSFIDPSNAQHVLAIGHHGMGSAAISEVFESRDGGTTFGARSLFATPAGKRLDGVEIARRNPNRIYLTTSPWTLDGTLPQLVRSDDGGKTFTVLPTSAVVTAGTLRIVTVDPENPDKLFLRFSGDARDYLLTSTDGGHTVAVALTADSGRQLTAFFRRSNGVLLAATFDAQGGSLFRSTDGGATFATLAANLHVSSMAERDGALYVLGDGIVDGFLVGISRDGGDTFESFLDTSAVQGIQGCGKDLRMACAASCSNLQNGGLFSPAVCSTLLATPARTPPGNAAAAGSSGCGVAAGPTSARLSSRVMPLLVALLAAALCVRRRR